MRWNTQPKLPEPAQSQTAARRGRIRRRIVIAVVAFLFLSGGALVLAAVILAKPGPVGGIPDTLAGLPLNHRVDGGEAAREIDRLHGRTIRVRAATVAHYERSGTVAMLYVSDTLLAFLADRQLRAMTEGMKKGESPFAPPREFQQAGQEIFWTLGQGQAHFYYRQGSKLIWVAANESVAFPALSAALRSIR